MGSNPPYEASTKRPSSELAAETDMGGVLVAAAVVADE